MPQALFLVKAAIIFSLAGARGTVTLASVMSIPLLLDNGTAFPERDLIILLASGVIVISMLIANFILPLFVKRISDEKQSDKEQAAYSEVIQGVISRLKREVTDENSLATDIVIRSYSKRNTVAHNTVSRQKETQSEKEMRTQIIHWEIENTTALLESGNTDKAAAEFYLYVLNERAKSEGSREGSGFFKRVAWFLKHIIKFRRKMRPVRKRGDFEIFFKSNTQYVLKKLDETKNKENAAIVEKLSAEFELMSSVSRRHVTSDGQYGMSDSAANTVAARAFSIERELIQEMFELGRITRETAKGMRADIVTLEAQLQSDF